MHISGIRRAQGNGKASSGASYKSGMALSIPKIMVIAFMLCDVAVQSRLTILMFDGAKTAALAIELLVIAVAILSLTIKKLPGFSIEATISLALLALIFLQMYIFTINSGSDFNFNGCGQFLALCAVAVFALRPREIDQNLKLFAFISAAYLLYYIYLCSMGSEALKESLRINDYERGERLYLANMYAIYALACGLRAKKSFNVVVRLVFVALALTAAVLSQSRVSQGVIALLLLGNLTTFGARLFPILSCGLFLGVSLFLLYGLFDYTFNPYEMFAGNPSGRARMIQYEAARSLLKTYTYFGVGITPQPSEMTRVTSMENFFSTDLGVVGLLISFGMLGLLAMVAITYLIGRHTIRSNSHDTIRFAALSAAMGAILYGFFTPFFYASAQIFISLALAIVFIPIAGPHRRAANTYGSARQHNFLRQIDSARL